MTVSARTPPFAGLLDDMPVSVEELWFGSEPLPCHPVEAVEMAGAVASRRNEFAAGRACARAALARLGIHHVILLRDADRCPIWPNGVVGSISHTSVATSGYAAAAVAVRERVIALGIDAEDAGPLARELWSLVARPCELRDLTVAGEDGGRRAKLLFAAKEAFYKAQFPLTRAWLDFHDVRIEFDLASGRFTAAVVGSGAPHPLSPCAGRFQIDEQVVRTAVVVAAAGSTWAEPGARRPGVRRD